MLVKYQEVLDCQWERLHNLPGTSRFVARHEFTKLSQMEEKAASLGEFFEELFKALSVAAKVADD